MTSERRRGINKAFAQSVTYSLSLSFSLEPTRSFIALEGLDLLTNICNQ